MLVSFYGKSSPKLVFTEACSHWDGICCHFVLIFKEDLFIFMLCGMCWVFCCLLYIACMQSPGGQERASEPPELKWVWELSPGSPPEQQVPLNTKSSLQPVLAFWGKVSLYGPCWPRTVPCQPPKGWDGRHALSWVVLVLFFKDMICHWGGGKSSYFKSFSRETALLFTTSVKWSFVYVLSSVVCVMVAKLNQELPAGYTLLPNVAPLCWGK